ncbi:MAG: M50 family metallopeptidase [Methanoregula sp.]|nr:M50 family metallopeptidase [Methanoregula sp.]
MLWLLASGLIFRLIFISSVSAFDLDQVYIQIDEQGDAVITMTYQDNVVEYLGIKSFIATSSPSIEKYQSVLIQNNGKSADFKILCASPGAAKLSFPHFASVNGKVYSTDGFDLASYGEESRQVMANYNYPVDLNADAVIVFPDGYSLTQKGVSRIAPVSHTLSTKMQSPPAPDASCKEDKQLPLSGIIPPEAEPVVAVGAGVAMTGLGLTAFGSAFSAWLAKLLVFVQSALGQVVQGRLSEDEKKKRALKAMEAKEIAFGFTRRELGVIALGAVIIGLLFFFAARTPFDLTTVAIYVIMGGIALCAHELAHWYLNRKYECSTEVQLWGLGSIIMFLTAWLFGNVFAQPTLTVVRSRIPLEKRSLGLIMLSGPVFSILIAIACLFLIPLGGVFRTAGMLGFSINLLAGVFELLPVTPCDGREVFAWNKFVWALVFVPLILIYFLVNI